LSSFLFGSDGVVRSCIMPLYGAGN